jgi:hypothetical protein
MGYKARLIDIQHPGAVLETSCSPLIFDRMFFKWRFVAYYSEFEADPLPSFSSQLIPPFLLH